MERLGYEAKGENCGCDIVAIKPGEPPFLVITQLKMTFTLDLVLQGVDRYVTAADKIWLAVRVVEIRIVECESCLVCLTARTQKGDCR